MPLSFLVCLTIKQPERLDKNFMKVGYKNVHRIFSGRSMYNDSIIGWFGHMENGSTYDSLEGI